MACSSCEKKRKAALQKKKSTSIAQKKSTVVKKGTKYFRVYE